MRENRKKVSEEERESERDRESNNNQRSGLACMSAFCVIIQFLMSYA